MSKESILEPVLFIHPAALYIPYKANLKQHLSWLFFLYHAREELTKKKSYVVSLQELKEGIDYKSEKNNQALIDSIKGLSKIRVQFDMFNPKTDWPYQALLKRCQIPRYTGGCRYSFHPEVHEKIALEEELKPLRLKIITNFKSKYSLAIYCLLISRIAPDRTYTEVNLNLNEVIQLLGYSEDDNLLPGDIKRKINLAEKELNELSDLTIRIEALQEKRRKITGFKFIAQLQLSQYEIYEKIYQPDEIEAITEEPPPITESVTTPVVEEPVIPSVKAVEPESPQVSTPLIPKEKKPIIDKKPASSKVTELNLNKIKNSKVRDEAIKLYHQRLNNLFKIDLKQLLQKHLESNFSQYQETFFRLLEANINSLMLRNIINRNMGRKNPSLMTASQTVADCMLEKYELFNFKPPEFEVWKEAFEELEGLTNINRYKEEALKTAEQIHRI